MGGLWLCRAARRPGVHRSARPGDLSFRAALESGGWVGPFPVAPGRCRLCACGGPGRRAHRGSGRWRGRAGRPGGRGRHGGLLRGCGPGPADRPADGPEARDLEGPDPSVGRRHRRCRPECGRAPAYPPRLGGGCRQPLFAPLGRGRARHGGGHALRTPARPTRAVALAGPGQSARGGQHPVGPVDRLRAASVGEIPLLLPAHPAPGLDCHPPWFEGRHRRHSPRPARGVGGRRGGAVPRPVPDAPAGHHADPVGYHPAAGDPGERAAPGPRSPRSGHRHGPGRGHDHRRGRSGRVRQPRLRATIRPAGGGTCGAAAVRPAARGGADRPPGAPRSRRCARTAPRCWSNWR